MKYLFLIFCLLLCFCGYSESPNDGFYFDEEKFMSEWNIWKNQDIKNYDFTLKGEFPYWNYSRAVLKYNYSIEAIPMYDYVVEIAVKNSIMNSFEYIGKTPHQEMNSESILEPEYTSISDMYEKIYKTIKNCELYWKETSNKGCFLSKRYEIKYDPKFHYITYFKPITTVAPDCILDTTEHEVMVSEFNQY